ncbi:MAG TPA: PEP-CTERM sorting domain-containing protein [Methylotenera sp.]|nr:PEP-CTERM sorting domain-containing protein [Methylotenera sp.]HPH05151.1 PEP-CTERM sorting domain-containing protein [Methylotenera sp.]HPN00515.1 PEP-CTERM sorting domain-containing protein [Methylotenera sp.]
MKAPYALLVLLSGLAAQGAQANILYSFDADTQGWTLTDGDLTYVSSGGNSGGYLNTTDTNSNDMALHAPVSALGNWSAYLNGTLSFDALNSNNRLSDYNGFGTVTISSGAQSVSFDLSPSASNPPNNGLWTSYSAVLSQAVWGSNLASVLSNVTSLTLSTENFVSSSFPDEQVGIDNISVTSVSNVPEPETYAMLLAGLGLIGFSARRKKS